MSGWFTPAMWIGSLWLCLGVVYYLGRFSGANKEIMKQKQASLDALHNREKSDDEIEKLGAAERRARLHLWVPDDTKEK